MILLVLGGLGLILGSFVNAFVWRLHNGKDWVRGRSECSHCHHVLGPLDLVPVFSWLALGGRCRYCHKKIEDSPLVEIALPLLFVLSYVFWPLPLEGSGLFEFVLWLGFLVGFAALALYDLRWFLLPNKIVFPLIALAVLQVAVIAIWQTDWSLLFGAMAGVLALAGIFYILFQMSRGTWIGGGDVKLGVVLGLLAGGWLKSFLLLFVASIAGLLGAIPMLVQGKANRKTHLPFGPFLILGLLVVKLWGADLLAWYTGLFYI